MSEFLQQKELVLASGSAVRAKLLRSLGLDFSIQISGCDEDFIKAKHGPDNILSLGFALAASKALAVSSQYPDSFILAADQLCVLNNQLFDKPLNYENACSQLSSLSGQRHQQIACMCIAKNNELIWQHHEVACLTLRELSLAQIQAYIKKEQPYQSCGAYQYETLGKWLFQDIEGTEDTILGLPLFPLTQALIQLGAVDIRAL